MSENDETVERVARAISDANWRDDLPREELDKHFNDEALNPLFLKQARAAIAAMPERGKVDALVELFREAADIMAMMAQPSPQPTRQVGSEAQGKLNHFASVMADYLDKARGIAGAPPETSHG